MLLDELTAFGQRRGQDVDVFVSEDEFVARRVVAKQVDEGEVPLENVVAFHRLDRVRVVCSPKSALIEVDNQSAAIWDDPTAIDFVQLGDTLDEVVIEETMPRFKVGEIADGEVADRRECLEICSLP